MLQLVARHVRRRDGGRRPWLQSWLLYCGGRAYRRLLGSWLGRVCALRGTLLWRPGLLQLWLLLSRDLLTVLKNAQMLSNNCNGIRDRGLL